MRTKVAIYLPDKYGRVLLAKHVGRQGKEEFWDIPGDETEDGETFKECAIRAVKDYVDIDVRDVTMLFEVAEHTMSGNWTASVVMASNYIGEPKIVNKDHFCEFRWFMFDRIPDQMYPVAKRVLARLARMLSEKHKNKDENIKAEDAARDREKAKDKEIAELKKAYENKLAELETAHQRELSEREKAEKEKLLNAPIDAERMILRRWKPDDKKDFAEYTARLVATKHSEHCIHRSPQTDNPKLDDYIKDQTRWAAELKAGGEIVGGLALEEFPGKDFAKEREITHTMDEKHTSGGFTTEATRALVNYGFEKLGLSTIYVSLCETNIGGIRVVQNLGFTFDSVSTNKQTCRFDGRLHETKNYSVTADEWRKLRAKKGK